MTPPGPLRGPEFGSYPADDVGWLLTDLSWASIEAPTAEREAAIQSGRAHYAESLPVEFQPDPAYLGLYHDELAQSARSVAAAVGTLCELVLSERGTDVVLVSLARAGTPIGVLLRRYGGARHGLDLPHYTMSIVRGRGIDRVALRWLLDRYDDRQLVFVDGWTGKGAIARELMDAVSSTNVHWGTALDARLAVLADPGHCAHLFGTREDLLVPSACLNSTVSGLVSRTVLNASISPGEFHGAKFYKELADADVSNEFVATIEASFSQVLDEVTAAVRVRPDTAAEPTWDGWRAVEELCATYGVDDLNLVKPGVGETTRVLLRRVPWQVLVRPDRRSTLRHVLALAEERAVPVVEVEGLAFSCVGLIRPAGR